MRQRQRPVATGRRGEALELRDACMLLAARHGVQREVGGAPVLEAGLGQGSRMNLADDELEHVVVVPGGLLAPAA
jgi:hypothetical protein